MKWEALQNIPEHRFRRRTGVKKPTFEKMVQVVKTTICQHPISRNNQKLNPTQHQN